MKKIFRLMFLTLSLVMALTLSVGASTTEPLPESDPQAIMVNDIFEHFETCQLFDKYGKEVTKDFLARHQYNYQVGNFEPIADEIWENEITLVYPVNEGVMPRLLINHSASSRMRVPYGYNGGRYTASFMLKMTSRINDYTNTFSDVDNITLVPGTLISDHPGMEAYWRTTSKEITGGTVCTQQGVVGLYYNNTSWDQIWLATGTVGTNYLSFARVR